MKFTQHNPTWCGAFTLIEIMIVVTIIGLLLAMAIPSFVRGREFSRSQVCIENLSQIESAKQRWALEYNKGPGDAPTVADLVGAQLFLRGLPVCPAGGTYDVRHVSTNALCSFPGHSL